MLSQIEQHEDPAYRAINAFTLAPGVISIDDSMGETDIYFILEMWDFIYPKIWLTGENDDVYKNPNTGIGLLPGVGRFPPVVGAGMALEYAKDHLTALASVKWYPLPEQFEVVLVPEPTRP